MKPEELEAFRPKLRVGELKEGYVLHWQVLQHASHNPAFTRAVH